MSENAATMPELAPLFDAFRRGTKRNRLRSLVVVCREGHAVLEVFPTAVGQFALWRRSATYYAEIVPDSPGPGHFVQLSCCRCQENMGVETRRVRDKLNAGQPRWVIKRWSDVRTHTSA